MKHWHTLDRIMQDRAAAQGDTPAYTFLRDGEIEDRTVTFAELDRQSRAVAAMLQEWCITRPLLVYAPGLDFIASFFGCLYAGITPIPAGLPNVARIGRALTRLSAIARDAEADAILSTSRVIDRALADPDFCMRAPELAAMRWLSTESVDPAQGDNWTAVEPNRDAFIQYTSGSTSSPKGVVVTQANLLHNLSACRSNGGNSEQSVSISWLPHSHDMGLIEGILLPAFVGYRAYLMAPAAFLARPARWLEAITRYRGTNSGGPDFAYALCVEKVSDNERKRLELSSWRVAYNGSESVRKNTLLRFRDRFERCGFHWNAFRPVYGLAESTLLVSTSRASEPPAFYDADADALAEGIVEPPRTPESRSFSFVSCGRSPGESRFLIVNPENRVPCRPGQVGEVWVAGPSVAAGYWRRPEETAATFKAYTEDGLEGPFLRTGDLGFCRDGQLFVTGRIKDVINIRGLKHYPQDIERTMARSHDAIHANGCAAFAITRDGVEQLAVIAEVKPRFRKTGGWETRVIDAIQHAVADAHGLMVHAVALVPFGAIPKTTSGKLERYACRRSFNEGQLQAVRVWSAY
jgi:acyl-CoA synthetase (AMP-forming)/AMP-acid ligase II